MNNDSIFNVLLYLDKKTLMRCLLTCHRINKLNSEYLWKQLDHRVYTNDHDNTVKWYYFDGGYVLVVLDN